MKPRSAKSQTKGRNVRVNKLLPARSNDLRRDAQLQKLLSELVLILLPFGITPMHFAELAKRAFVIAAGQISRFRNGKFNQSRIAVITGLNRAEVKRLLQESRRQPSVSDSRLSRTERVISGWLSDRRFLDKRGQPRKLSTRGRSSSFAYLVRAFAGDVPHRAVLDELKRSRSVSQVGDIVELKSRHAVSNARLSKAIAQVLPVLLDGIHLAAVGQQTGEAVPLYRLTIDAKDSVELAMLRERLSSGAASLISGFGASLKRKPAAQNGRKHTITITAFVRERAPPRKTGTTR